MSDGPAPRYEVRCCDPARDLWRVWDTALEECLTAALPKATAEVIADNLNAVFPVIILPARATPPC